MLLNVWFGGSCHSSKSIGASGMHFADEDEVPFNTPRKYDWGYASSHSEFFGHTGPPGRAWVAYLWQLYLNMGV